MEKLLKRHLIWAEFDFKYSCPRYTIRLWIDAVFAILYTIISIVVIFMQKADMIVLSLNTLCLFRTFIHNTISASEVTDTRSVDSKCGRFNYYHIKAALIFGAALIYGLVWCCLKYSVVDWVIRVFASVALVVVLLDDLDELIIYAYGCTYIEDGGVLDG